MNQRFLGALVGVLVLGSLVEGATFRTKNSGTGSTLPSGGGNWMTAANWTLLSGTDADGIPDIDDDVTLYPAAWPYGYDLALDAGWSANTINVIANDGNDCNINVQADGTVNTLNWNRTVANYSWRLTTGYTQFHLGQFHDIGPLPGRLLNFSSPSSIMSFTGASVIEYNTNADSMYTMRMDFGGATSVNLLRSLTSSSLTSEKITTWGGNNGWLFTIGRTDNGTQTWTVAANSHPALMPGGSSQDAGILKTGTGNVQMPDVDLIFNMTNTHPADDGQAISAGGTIGDGLYSGTIFANSLTVGPAASSGGLPRTFALSGKLVIDGQGGLQAGGTGNGRAVSAIASDTDLILRLTSPSGPSTYVGQVKILPGGGTFYADGTGAGKTGIIINNQSRDYHTDVNTPAIIANDITFGAKTYVTDRNTWQDIDANAHGIIEFRGRFSNASTQNTLWRTENTTLRAIGGGGIQTLEALSNDLGTGGPGASNFLFDQLVFGRDSASTNLITWAHLTNSADNATGTGSEAVYVNTLALYAGSILELRGINIYYKNGGGSWLLATPSTTVPFAGGDGTGFILVPEPTALTLLAGLGAAALLRRRRA